MTQREYEQVEAAMKGMLDGYLASLRLTIDAAQQADTQQTDDVPGAAQAPYDEVPPDFSKLPPTQGLAMKLRYYNPSWSSRQVAEKVTATIVGAQTTWKTVNTFVRNFKQEKERHQYLRPHERPASH